MNVFVNIIIDTEGGVHVSSNALDSLLAKCVLVQLQSGINYQGDKRYNFRKWHYYYYYYYLLLLLLLLL